jgi:hypothetical protein
MKMLPHQLTLMPPCKSSVQSEPGIPLTRRTTHRQWFYTGCTHRGLHLVCNSAAAAHFGPCGRPAYSIRALVFEPDGFRRSFAIFSSHHVVPGACCLWHMHRSHMADIWWLCPDDVSIFRTPFPDPLHLDGLQRQIGAHDPNWTKAPLLRPAGCW